LLSTKIDRYIQITGSSMYIKKLMLTRDKLFGCGIKDPLDYELHIPMLMKKEKLKHIISKYPSCLWRSMYGNVYNVGGSQIEDVKIYTNKRHSARSNEITEHSTFLSTEDQAFGLALDKVLSRMFNSPTKHEQV